MIINILKPGAALASMRKIVEKECAYINCIKLIEGTTRKKYCNDTCKQAQRAVDQKVQRALKKKSK